MTTELVPGNLYQIEPLFDRTMENYWFNYWILSAESNLDEFLAPIEVDNLKSRDRLPGLTQSPEELFGVFMLIEKRNNLHLVLDPHHGRVVLLIHPRRFELVPAEQEAE